MDHRSISYYNIKKYSFRFWIKQRSVWFYNDVEFFFIEILNKMVIKNNWSGQFVWNLEYRENIYREVNILGKENFCRK